MPSPPSDRRSSARIRASLHLRVLLGGRPVVEAVTADVSAGGLLFFSEAEALAPGMPVEVRLERARLRAPFLPPRGLRLRGRGRVVRVGAGAPRARAVAIRFDGPLGIDGSR